MSEKGDQIQIVKIEGEGVKSVANLLMILIVAFVMTVPFSIGAIIIVVDQKRQMDEQMDDLRWSNRQLTYWSEQVSTKLDAMNVHTPYPDLTQTPSSTRRKHHG